MFVVLSNYPNDAVSRMQMAKGDLMQYLYTSKSVFGFAYWPRVRPEPKRLF